MSGRYHKGFILVVGYFGFIKQKRLNLHDM